MVESVTRDARDFFGSDKAAEDVAAAGVVTNSMIQSYMVNFYLKFNKPKVPTKLFLSEEAAKKWLMKFVK